MSESNAIKLVYVLFFGSIIGFHLSVAYLTPFPRNDGGLIYSFISDLRQNNMFLPEFTSYNHLQIPFAYPPLGLYLGAILAYFVPITTVLRFAPIGLYVLSAIALYMLAKRYFKSESKATLTVAIFTLTPASFLWNTAGGGITRSLGMLFSILTLYAFFGYKENRGAKPTILTSVFLALTVLSHPEWTLFTGFALVFLALADISASFPDKIRLLARIFVSALIFVSPWIGMVVIKHGPDIFLRALGSGIWQFNYLLQFLTFRFSSEMGLHLVSVVGLISFMGLIINKQFMLPVWLMLNSLLSPRSAANSNAIILPLIIVSFLNSVRIKFKSTQHIGLNQTLILAGFLFIPYYLFFTGGTSQSIVFGAVTQEEQKAMKWVSENLTEDANFLVVTPSTFSGWASNSTAEWFPTLANRRSVLTPQGIEWLDRNRFHRILEAIDDFVPCRSRELKCVTDWAEDHRVEFSHMFVSDSKIAKNAYVRFLQYDLNQSTEFKLIHTEGGVTVWERV